MSNHFMNLTAAAGAAVLAMALTGAIAARADTQSATGHQVPQAEKRALAITRQMLRALAYAHGQGVLHRDLKPGNVVLSTPDAIAGEDVEPIVKVLDFGLAKLARSASRPEASITADGVAFGTPGYVSPEVLLGRPSDARSDLFAVGVILFEMLLGRRPHG